MTRGIGSDLVAPVGKVTDALDSAKDTILRVAQKMVTAVHNVDQAITPDDYHKYMSDIISNPLPFD